MNRAAAEQDAVKVQSSQKPRKGELHGASNDALTVKQKTNAGAQGGKVAANIKFKKGAAGKNAQHPCGEKRD